MNMKYELEHGHDEHEGNNISTTYMEPLYKTYLVLTADLDFQLLTSCI